MIDVTSSDPVVLNGSCHCGGVQFVVKLTQGFASARRCTCSICRMRGAVAATSTPLEFNITAGADKLSKYQFNSRVAEHYFCRICGIYTHHKRRSNPSELGVNIACLDGVSPFDFPAVPVNDGNRHPADDPKHETYLAGVLRFEPVPV